MLIEVDVHSCLSGQIQQGCAEFGILEPGRPIEIAVDNGEEPAAAGIVRLSFTIDKCPDLTIAEIIDDSPASRLSTGIERFENTARYGITGSIAIDGKVHSKIFRAASGRRNHNTNLLNVTGANRVHCERETSVLHENNAVETCNGVREDRAARIAGNIDLRVEWPAMASVVSNSTGNGNHRS